MGDWHNIATQDDIESLLSAYGDFHDACIVEAHFKSGTFVDEASAMYFGSANEYILSLIFQCQWTPKTIELQFIGLRQFHLAGWQENYACNIFDVDLAFHDDLLPGETRSVIVWADNRSFNVHKIAPIISAPADTYVVSNALRWRIADE